MNGAGGRLIRKVIDARRWQVLRMLWQASPVLFFALVLDILAMSVLPNLVLVALGVLVGHVPPAVAGGLGSPAGDRLAASFVFVVVVFTASMLASPFHQALASAIKVRLTYVLQSRLMAAVGRPAGIAHLEDPGVRDRVAMAQGTLISWFPADAPASLATVWSSRLTAALACLVVAAFVPWVGLLFLILWPATRRPIMRVIAEHVAAFGGNADVMRRAEYFRQLATRPPAAKEIRIFGLGDWVVDTFRATWQAGMTDVWSIRAGIHKVMLRVGLLLMTAYCGASAYLAWAAFNGQLDLRAVAMILPALGITMTSGGVTFEDISLEWMLSAVPHLDGLEKEMAQKVAALPGTASSAGMPASQVQFDHVAFTYPGGGAPVFDELDIVLPAGRSTAIVGANGAGKTTLVKLLARLHDPSSGRIVVDGVDLRSLDAAEWQQRIAVVFQDFVRLPLSANDNVGFGSVGHIDDLDGVRDAAALAGVSVLVDGLPSGWNTWLSPQFVGGVDLSGGQWQRMALARALFAARHGASVLVLDEPTAWMDVRGEAEFFGRFLEITEGLTTLIISHRFSTVRLADHICVIEDGRVSEEGAHGELLARGGHYARLFRLQAARFADSAAGAGQGTAPA